MRIQTISISSDSSYEDDVPLKTIKLNGYAGDPNAYDTLCQRNLQACEFCDRISNNRYSSLIHNVSHIIIPLLNQTVFQCPTCLHSFTSQKDLRIHDMKKHSGVNVALNSLVNDSRSTWSPSNSSCNSYTKEAQTGKPIKGEKILLQEAQTEKPIKEEKKIMCIDTKFDEESNSESIKNRLVFEDDDLIVLDCNQLLSDLTTDCKVNLEVFHTPWLNGEMDNFSGKSVHYEELIKPGVYRCKKCGKGFPIRYDAIVHESMHIKFKNTQIRLCRLCKKYVVGGRNDLRHHYLTLHNGNLVKNQHLETENVPQLKIYENIEEKKQYDTKILSLCDLCFSFCKNTHSKNYECVDTVSRIGRRNECEKCGQLFFELNLVRRWQRRALYRTTAQNTKKRKKTNEDRLKTIANRFKMMKH